MMTSKKNFSGIRVLWAIPRSNLLACLAAGGLCLGAIGCGGKVDYRIAPVSGKVTLDGKPLPGILVNFQPVSSGKAEAGPGSVGVTDDQGRFTLDLVGVKPKPGAVAGKHRVTFATKQGERDAGDDTISSPAKEVIPAQYLTNPQEFEVPAAGTDKADFPLTSGGSTPAPAQPRSGYAPPAS